LLVLAEIWYTCSLSKYLKLSQVRLAGYYIKIYTNINMLFPFKAGLTYFLVFP